MRKSDWLTILSSTLVVACGPERGGDDGPGITDSPTSIPGDNDGTSDGGIGDGGNERFDVGGSDGSGEGPGEGKSGCKGIDFLFVIDNSGSMGDEQQNLVSSFPGFVQSIQTKVAELGADNFHILVTDTDAATVPPPSPACSLECLNNPSGTCSDGSPCALSSDPNCLITCTTNIHGTCSSGLECSDLVDCDPSGCSCELGAGKIKDKDDNDCPVDGMQRYLQAGQPDLGGTFACLAEVGTEGSGTERQVQALVRALSDELHQPGGCNEGFLRNDSILVVTLITDEEDSPDDDGSPGDPPGWKASVVAAKNGNESGVVMLGLVGDTGSPNAVCQGFDGSSGGEASPRLREFVSSFDNHVLGSVCESDYSGFFQSAVDLIQNTCEDYVPPA